MEYSLEAFGNYNNYIASTFNVNPAVFILIYLVATPFYYYGWYRVGKEATIHVRDRKRNKKRISPHDLFLEKGFLIGYTTNRLSWAAPYFYVIIWGRDIQIKYYFLFCFWLMVSIYLFTHKLNNKYAKSV